MLEHPSTTARHRGRYLNKIQETMQQQHWILFPKTTVKQKLNLTVSNRHPPAVGGQKWGLPVAIKGKCTSLIPHYDINSLLTTMMGICVDKHNSTLIIIYLRPNENFTCFPFVLLAIPKKLTSEKQKKRLKIERKH